MFIDVIVFFYDFHHFTEVLIWDFFRPQDGTDEDFVDPRCLYISTHQKMHCKKRRCPRNPQMFAGHYVVVSMLEKLPTFVNFQELLVKNC